MIGLRHRDDGRYDKMREVSFLTGCAFLIKAGVVREIGVMEEVYFHFYDDIEWSLRVTQAGFKGVYVPKAVIWHREHFDTNKNHRNGFIEFYLARGNMIFARKPVPRRLWPFKMPFFAAWMVYRTWCSHLSGIGRKCSPSIRDSGPVALAKLPEEDTSV